MLCNADGMYRDRYERVGVEIHQGCTREDGEVKAAPAAVVVWLWGVRTPRLEMWQVRAFCFGRQGHKQECLDWLMFARDEARLDEYEITKVQGWIELIERLPGVEDDSCCDGDAEHDPGRCRTLDRRSDKAQ